MPCAGVSELIVRRLPEYPVDHGEGDCESVRLRYFLDPFVLLRRSSTIESLCIERGPARTD